MDPTGRSDSIFAESILKHDGILANSFVPLKTEKHNVGGWFQQLKSQHHIFSSITWLNMSHEVGKQQKRHGKQLMIVVFNKKSLRDWNLYKLKEPFSNMVGKTSHKKWCMYCWVWPPSEWKSDSWFLAGPERGLHGPSMYIYNMYRIPIPIGSMYGIFTYIWLIFMVNVGI